MLKHWNWHPLTLSSFSCSCYTAKWSCCCSAFSCNRDRSSGKNYHFYIFHCDTLAICLIAVALLLQTQILSRDKAWCTSEEIFPCFVFGAALKRLNWGSLQQWGQYHLLGSGVAMAKQDGWNSINGQSGLQHFTVFPSEGILRKQIPAYVCCTLQDKSHFRVYHLPKISGKMHTLQKVLALANHLASYKDPDKSFPLQFWHGWVVTVKST